MIRQLALTLTVPALFLVWPADPPGAAERPVLDALVSAYPEQLAGYDATDLLWRDGTRMPLSDGKPGKSFEEGAAPCG